MKLHLPVPLVLAAALVACGSDAPACAGCDGAGGAADGEHALSISMDFTRAGGLYAAPFPSDDRLVDGVLDLTGAPNGTKAALGDAVITLLQADVHGFGTTSGVFFTLGGSLGDVALPDAHASLRPAAVAFLVDVDPGSPELGKRRPVDVAYLDDGGPFGAPHMLSLLPVQGLPLRPSTRYAAVVTTALASKKGVALTPDASMKALVAGDAPRGLAGDALAHYRDALDALDAAGTPRASIAGLAVFTTDAPISALDEVAAAMLAAPLPQPDAPFAPGEVFDRYCVFSTTIAMSEYQAGAPPYTDDGGAWAFDASGAPVVQRQETANFVVTVPRQAMPAAGFPIVLFSRTGGGGERPLVDRGVQLVHDAPAITPGSGPADDFAMAGFAGASVDGPLGGLRNPDGSDEQFLIFNVSNPRALRDNIRQSAAELMLTAHVLAALSFDASSCPGFSSADGNVSFDRSTIALMGHSMGATIAPLALAREPLFRAGILSGAGGSWIENVIYKKSPLAVAPLAEVLLGLSGGEYHLSAHDPLLSLFQWGGEPADPPVYAAGIVREPPAGASPRHVLMEQGIVDTYILPPIANATSLSIGLDMGGDELDVGPPALAGMTPFSALSDLAGRGGIALPASGNVTVNGTAVTALVIQHPEDGVEDGHEVIFQTDAPKREYVCFLRDLAAGKTPRVPVGSAGAVGTCD